MGIELNLEFSQFCRFKLELEMLLNFLCRTRAYCRGKKNQWELPETGWQPSTGGMLELIHSLVQQLCFGLKEGRKAKLYWDCVMWVHGQGLDFWCTCIWQSVLEIYLQGVIWGLLWYAPQDNHWGYFAWGLLFPAAFFNFPQLLRRYSLKATSSYLALGSNISGVHFSTAPS